MNHACRGAHGNAFLNNRLPVTYVPSSLVPTALAADSASTHTTNLPQTVRRTFTHAVLHPPVTGSLRTSVFWGKIAGVSTYLIRPTDWNACNIFKGDRIYGGSYNELGAYLYLCRCEQKCG